VILECSIAQGFGSFGRRELVIAQNVPLLAGTLHVLVSSPGHDHMHTGHVDPWLETAGGDIALEDRAIER
jgi:hypothetical protein